MKVEVLTNGIAVGTIKLPDGWYYWTCDNSIIVELGEVPEGDNIGPYPSKLKALHAGIQSIK